MSEFIPPRISLRDGAGFPLEFEFRPIGTKWRAYWVETIQSYDTSFGRGGACSHERFHAARYTDGTFVSDFTLKTAQARLKQALEEGGLLP